MSNDFARLRKNSSIERLSKALEQQGKGKYTPDSRYWQPTADKAGNGFAVIRFLDSPEVDGEEANPFIILYSHHFEGPTGLWYIENSLTTVGEKDPVGELNSKLWETGTKENKDRASKQSRRTSFISNILVVNDPAHPENNGKVFLYSYGKKIMDKIKDKMGVGTEESELSDPDEVKFNPFNFWEGGNFKLNIRKIEGYRNYDKSVFQSQSPVLNGDDGKIEALWKSLNSLKAEGTPNKFKSYGELKSKLDRVLGLAGSSGGPAQSKKQVVAEQEAQVSEDVPTAAEADAEIVAATTPTVATEDDEFADFARLANR